MGENFLEKHKPEQNNRYEMHTAKIVSANVDGSMMAKAGSMIAYEGELSFTGKASAEGGVLGFVKEAATSEGSPVMEIEGTGKVYLADHGKRIQLINLGENDQITVNGDDVLAFGPDVDYEVNTMSGISGASAGGLVNVFLSGPGIAAITTHGDPIVLEPPVKTDPAATVAWDGDLKPKTDIDTGLKDVVGQSSGETFQMKFEGEDGFVIVQSVEEM